MSAGDIDTPVTSRLRVTIADGRTTKAATRGLAAWLARVAPRGAAGELGIALVSDVRMRGFNRQYRHADYATDVLSFQPDRDEMRVPGEPRLLGDIVIASGVARRQAKAAGHSLATELRVLALHGLLHLLGYDHEIDDGRMARVERRLRRKGGLERGLIERGRAR